jgi:UDP-2-acetamido-3-amino-2,3-dideoxy-glucuronate N-acetyltransferase
VATIIHPSAIVDACAQLGDGCRDWHFVPISVGARISKRCSFGQNVYPHNDVTIANGVKFQANALVYDALADNKAARVRNWS